MAEERPKSDLAKKEEEILKFWKENDIFKKTLEKDSPKGEFVFYEGPPTANGRPGIHHVEARSFKDAIPRFRTMQGYHVRRKAGWDTHGLPVELEVEKELGISSKPEIEKFGIAKFNELCKKNVWKYVDEWHDFTERMGYFVDMDDAYVTYRTPYIESLWWVLKQISDKGLLYKDYKVVPWCSRCGTALSSHELAQGYADVKDLSVTAKFKLKDEEDTYILAWTTTPWTLPGNVALAVGPEITYLKVVKEDSSEKLILAKDRLQSVLGETGYKILEEIKGTELVGLEYESLYPYLSSMLPDSESVRAKNAFKVHPADFVTTEDGTGVVHTAVMYGQDDFELGSKIGLPKFHLVNDTGHFISGTDFLEGRFVKDEDVAVDIIKDLANRGLLFDKHKYEHSYPHCWRCKTPLIYYARDSWYIRMTEVKDELVRENEKINWEPNHIKEGRFGEWLSGIRDWAISRERYWGTPIPVWVSEDGKDMEVIGSIDDLKSKTTSHNRFFVVRHGEGEHNVENIINSSVENSDKYPLTEKGRQQIKELAEKLKSEKFDEIYVSPFLRSRQTAEIIAEAAGFPVEKMIVDERLRELGFGDLDGGSFDQFIAIVKSEESDYKRPLPNGESYYEAKKRFGDFLYEINRRGEGRNILVVSHGVALESIAALIEGADEARSKQILEDMEPKPGQVLDFEFAPLPHNQDYELDLHRPYIDDITWVKDGKTYKRIPEVLDVWFDSGAMPFAEDHYPFENKEWIDKKGFPADFISEAIDQTRGWFYTLHAVGVLLGKGHAYNNVICLGHILDKDGLKMSKSKGNTVSPWEMADKYGIDVLRFWMYSINQPGESKNFDEKTVDEVSRKVFNLLGNTLSFYKMYAPETVPDLVSDNNLDIWIIAKTEELTTLVTNGLSNYRLFEPSRAIRDFIADFSQWYVRRSRDRFKDESADRHTATATMRFVLKRLAIILAPFAPFFAEYIYQEIKKPDEKESVHLENWPTSSELSADEKKCLELMDETRNLSSLALEARSKAGIKIRQPLAKLVVKSEHLKGAEDYLSILKDEVNVKEIVFDPSLAEEVLLDTALTPELITEGQRRDFMRFIQDLRKKAGLSPQDKARLSVSTENREFINEFAEELQSSANIEAIDFGEAEGEEIILGDSKFKVSLSK